MPYENAPTQAPVPVPRPAQAADAAERRAPEGAGYEQQAAALSPKSAEPPKFDQWSLTPEVQAIFVTLGQTEDKKVIEGLVNQLVRDHGVPKETVAQVVQGNKGFFSKAYDAIKSGSWKTISTNDQGQITSVFHADDKGLGWEKDTWKLEADFKDPKLTYTDKDDDWWIAGGYKDDQGYVSAEHGDKDEGGRHSYTVRGGEDGASAEWQRVKGEETQNANAGYTITDGGGTASAGWSRTEGKSSDSVSGEVTHGEDSVSGKAQWARVREGESDRVNTTFQTGESGHGGSAKYTRVRGDETQIYDGNVRVGDTTSGGLSYYTGTNRGKKDEDSHSASATFTHGESATGGTAQYTRKRDGVTNDGKVTVNVGDEVVSGNAVYTRTDSEGSHSGRASVKTSDTQTEASAGYTRTEGKDRTVIDGTVYSGEKTGGKLSGNVVRDGYSANGSVDGSVTERDGTTTTEAGGNATYKRTPGEDGTPTTVNIHGRYKRVEQASGDQTTTVTVGGGVKHGTTTANVKVTNQQGEQNGVGFQITELNADTSFDLERPEGESLTLKGLGQFRLSDREGEEGTFYMQGQALWSKGEGDSGRELELTIGGGRQQAGDIASRAHAESGMLGGDTSYGTFGHVAGQYSRGQHRYQFDATYGQTAETRLFGSHLGYNFGDQHQVDFYASVAERDEGTSQLFKATGQFALSKGFSLSAGGEYRLRPTDEGHSELWHMYAGAGWEIRDDMDLTLRMGVAQTGEQIVYVPEATFEWDKKLDLSALAVIPQGDAGNATFGAQVGIKQADITLFGGYGDASALMSPGAGSGGMTMPSMTGNDVFGHSDNQGAFVGIKWNALPTLKKLFGN